MPARSKRFFRSLVLTFLFAFLCAPGHAQERFRNPVDVVATNTFPVTGSMGKGLLPFYANRSLDFVNPDVTRAVIVIHGRLRNAGTYFLSALSALQASGDEGPRTLLIAPQFLAEIDGGKRPLAQDTLRWPIDGWQSGEDALSPAPVSSFEAIDGLLERLSKPALFPALRSVVIVGHLAGGQMVQRYAMLGRGEADLMQRDVHLRYVAANSSSYAYFDTLRPDGEGHFNPFPTASCPAFNEWPYGTDHLPRYASETAPGSVEQHYIQRDVVYLLGTEDTDPNQIWLDRSCMGEAEGPTRLARGNDYFAYLKMRHPTGLMHRVVHVQGVGHNGDRMLTSECGMSVLFDRPGCGSS